MVLRTDAWSSLLEVAEAHPDAHSGELGHDVVSVAATAISRACDRLLVDVGPGGGLQERWEVSIEGLVASRMNGCDPDETELSRRIAEVTEAFLAGTAGVTGRLVPEPLQELLRLREAYGTHRR